MLELLFFSESEQTEKVYSVKKISPKKAIKKKKKIIKKEAGKLLSEQY